MNNILHVQHHVYKTRFTNTWLRIGALFTPTPCRYPRPLFRRVRQPQPADSVRSSDSIKRSWRHQRAPLLTQRLRVRWGRLQRIIGKLQFLLAVIGQERCCPDLLLFRTSFLAPCVPHAVVVHLLPRATCRLRGRCFPLMQRAVVEARLSWYRDATYTQSYKNTHIYG